MRLVAGVLESDGGGGAGILSPAHWVCWRLGVTRSRANQIVRMARRWSELPHLAETFGGGRLSFEQAHLIARYCPTEYHHDVVDFAVMATISQLSSTLRGYGFDADPPAVREPHDRASASFTESGRYRLQLDLDAESGARVDAAIGQVRKRLYAERDGELELPSLVDAITECFNTAAESDPSPGRRAANRVLLHVDLDRLRDADEAMRLAGWFHLGPVLPSEWVQAGLCDADVQVLVSRGGVPVALGRTTRTVPPWLRELILDRDGGCRFPGCGSRRFLDVHHIEHWCEGGATDPANLVCLCRRHHRAHHRGQFDIVGNPSHPTDPDALRFVNRHGIQLRPPPPRPPDRLPNIDYQHPLGERLDRSQVVFQRRPQPEPGHPDLN